MNKFLIPLILVVAVGGWFVYQRSSGGADEERSYAYQCDNSMQFTIMPAEDFSWVAIFPGENAPFSQQTLTYQNNLDGMLYSGSDIAFVGVGEDIILQVTMATTSCNQVSSQNKTPWNWDDKGAGIEQNMSLIVAGSMVGKWQSTDDAKFIREFKADGTFVDTYAGAETGHGLWSTFTSENSPTDAFPLVENNTYIQLADSDVGVIYFKIIEMTPASLSMIYMDRGGVLNFVLAQ